MRVEFVAQPSEDDLDFLDSQQAEARYGEPITVPLGAFFRDEYGGLLGGVFGLVSGSWLSVDYLWVDEKLRGRRYGLKLMQAIEQAGVERGVSKAFLGTTSFQAPAFYEKLGYRVVVEWGIQDGQTQYLMMSDELEPYGVAPDELPTVEVPPNPQDHERLESALEAYNANFRLTAQQKLLGAVLVRDETEQLVGGVQGMLLYNRLWVHGLWFADASLATEAIHRLESAAKECGVSEALARTDDQVVAAMLAVAGFAELLRIDDFPDRRTTYLMHKRLA